MHAKRAGINNLVRLAAARLPPPLFAL